ncbi:MAG: hypothetical protein EPO06_11965 [Burkholderiaceae bacterium]|nr:MAG: hypothetical protein EPO06_11965 [Burkholderiaceae bacterium]
MYFRDFTTNGVTYRVTPTANDIAVAMFTDAIARTGRPTDVNTPGIANLARALGIPGDNARAWLVGRAMYLRGRTPGWPSTFLHAPIGGVLLAGMYNVARYTAALRAAGYVSADDQLAA